MHQNILTEQPREENDEIRKMMSPKRADLNSAHAVEESAELIVARILRKGDLWGEGVCRLDQIIM
jgi:hypothetical protein